MKLNKDQLKQIVKECLVEILNEGLSNISSNNAFKTYDLQNQKQQQVRQQIKQQYVSPLDIPIGQKNIINSSIEKAIQFESKGDPLMSEILKDTAINTLPNMTETSNNQNLSMEHFNGKPEDVFGIEAASKWANLAFATVKK